MNAVFSHRSSMDKVLLFLPGTHGNFLAKCLSVCSGVVEDFEFYSATSKGAHNQSKDFERIIEFTHESVRNNITCYINFNHDDLYILNWHLFYAAGEFGIDLLQVNEFTPLKKHMDLKSDHSIVTNGFPKIIQGFEGQGQSGLREMYKKFFKDGNGLCKRQAECYFNHKFDNIFQFSWFYDKDMFINNVKHLVKELGYEYKIDIVHKWEDFALKKLAIRQSKEFVEQAFVCYNKGIDLDISQLCVFEQAYLDHLIEEHLGYEIENWEHYPKNIKDLKPVQAWDGKKYEL